MFNEEKLQKLLSKVVSYAAGVSTLVAAPICIYDLIKHGSFNDSIVIAYLLFQVAYLHVQLNAIEAKVEL